MKLEAIMITKTLRNSRLLVFLSVEHLVNWFFFIKHLIIDSTSTK